MAATVIYDNTGIGWGNVSQTFSTAQLSVIAEGDGGGDNYVIPAFVLSYNLDRENMVSVASLTYDGVDFTLGSGPHRFLDDKCQIWMYYLVAPNYGVHKEIKLTMSRTCKYTKAAFWSVYNAYQGAPFYNWNFGLNESPVPGTPGPVTVVVTSTYTTGSTALVHAFHRNLQEESSALYSGEYQGLDGSSAGGLPSGQGNSSTAYGHKNANRNSEENIGMYYGYDADPADWIAQMVEVRYEDWVPPDPNLWVTASFGCVNILGSIFTGLDHLEGEIVGIMADGEYQGQQTVSNGAITLNSSYSVVKVGLPYASDLETLNIELESEKDTLQGRKTKIGNVVFRVEDSRGGWIGPNKDELFEAFNEIDVEMSAGVNLSSTELFTGDVRMPLGGRYENSGNVYYRQIEPLPITIGAIVPEIAPGGSAR